MIGLKKIAAGQWVAWGDLAPEEATEPATETGELIAFVDVTTQTVNAPNVQWTDAPLGEPHPDRLVLLLVIWENAFAARTLDDVDGFTRIVRASESASVRGAEIWAAAVPEGFVQDIDLTFSGDTSTITTASYVTTMMGSTDVLETFAHDGDNGKNEDFDIPPGGFVLGAYTRDQAPEWQQGLGEDFVEAWGMPGGGALGGHTTEEGTITVAVDDVGSFHRGAIAVFGPPATET